MSKYEFLRKTLRSQNLPAYNLGRIAVFSFLIAFITGIYLFFFYRIDPLEAYNSTETISRQFIGGMMRTLHRYSSDLLMIATALHFLQILARGRYKQKVSWLTGAFSWAHILVIGITGFILVWDQKAKLIGLLTMKFFTTLPFVSESILGMFFVADLKFLSGFFRIAFVAHFFLSVFLLGIIYFHVTRVGNRKFLPSPALMYLIIICLLIMSFLFPVQSDAPADMKNLPVRSTFNLYYFSPFFLIKFIPLKLFAVLGILIPTLILLLPFLIPSKIISRKANTFFSVTFAILFISIPLFSGMAIQYYPPEQKMLILSFRYTSSPTETENYHTDLKHMEYSTPIVKRRSPIEVQILSEDGEKLYSRTFEPSGIRKNSAITVYDEILLNTTRKVKVRVIETEIPKKRAESSFIKIEGVFILNTEITRLLPYQ
jgi:quinol-cytochrome oxidoreductase complex cytochrome b subunit